MLLTDPVPTAISFLNATPGRGVVSLGWTAVADASGYNIQRATIPGGPYAPLAQGVTGTNFTDVLVHVGTAYYYVVTATNVFGAGFPSAEARAVPFNEIRYPVADAHVRDGTYADVNYGTNPTLEHKLDPTAGFNRESFLRFDVAGLDQAAHVQLGLVPTRVSATWATLACERVASDSWLETGLTWNRKPAGSGLVITNRSGFATNTPVLINVTAPTRSEAAADGWLSLRLASTVSGVNFDFGARAQTNAALRPRLLVATYLDAWISPADLDHVQSLGFNAVRLPLSSDTFLHENGTWRSNAFARVDWLVTNAWERGIYTILDYHAFLPPGADQDGSVLGYWNNPTQQAETVRIWRRIAEHYRRQPAVAAYDLLNEPNNSAPEGRPEPSAEVVCALYDQLYQAIREVDPHHLIAMEGVWDWKTLRHPVRAGYRNVVYSFHWYHWRARSAAEQQRLTDADLRGIEAMWQAYPVPVLIGEFNFFGHPAAWSYGLKRYDEAGLSWTLWTYKNRKSGDNSWGVLTTLPGRAPPVPDLTTDSAEGIRAKWLAWATAGGAFAFNPMLKPLLLAHLRPAARACGAANP